MVTSLLYEPSQRKTEFLLFFKPNYKSTQEKPSFFFHQFKSKEEFNVTVIRKPDLAPYVLSV